MAENDPGSAPTDAAPDAGVPELSDRNAQTARAKGGRKRTKTGCLTCRRRRIKCGEEKPVCKNCIKSRRECEGYGQRVIFRQPVGPIPPGGPIMPASNAPGAMDATFPPGQPAYSVFPEDAAGRRPSLLPVDPQRQAYDAAQGSRIQNYSTSDAPHVGTGSGYAQPGDAPQPTPMHGVEEPSHGKNLDSFPDQSGHAFLSPGLAKYANVTTAAGQGIHHPSFRGAVPQNFQYQTVEQDDDLYDIETDDDFDMESDHSVVVPLRSKPWVMTMPSGGTSDQGPESSATYISYNNLLASYRPSPFSSPLLEPEAAQIFSHFITSVAPAISIFERCPANRSLMGPSSSVSTGYQNLWTYVMPCKALQHQALLHAMLATSSFHLARMTGQVPTASYRHYHYALRRVRKAVGLPQRRRQVETLAATLLLGYYEVLDAEHSKWSNHIVGGSRLVQEFNFAGMTKVVRRMRARVKEQQAYLQSQGFWSDVPGANQGWGLIDDAFSRAESDVDEGLVSVLMGRSVDYNDFRHTSDKVDDYQADQVLSEKDLYEFRIRCDLYWWYCKQDLYQSLVSGNQLLVPYHRWGKCPPRAGVGDLNAIYGTEDHLMLLLARVAEFAAKDRKRKRKVMAANDGKWRPRAGSCAGTGGDGTAPPEAQPAAKNSSAGQPAQKASPPMDGMAPAAPVRIPDGFAQSPPSSGSPHSQSEPLESQQDVDLASAKAESEWNDMLAACQELVQALGPGFQPLPSDVVPSIPTPFGPALQYRTHTIAVIWAYYYTLLILLHRVHPSMPPASMIAAGVAASQTAEYAQLIGRIIGGIHTPSPAPKTRHAAPTLDVGDVSSVFCGVIAETQICSFYAGVQYEASEQRVWLMSLLRDIERLTGARSATAIAWGCETAWMKAYEQGKGPEYIRPVEPEYVERKYGVVNVDGMEKRWVTVPQEETIRIGSRLLAV